MKIKTFICKLLGHKWITPYNAWPVILMRNKGSVSEEEYKQMVKESKEWKKFSCYRCGIKITSLNSEEAKEE